MPTPATLDALRRMIGELDEVKSEEPDPFAMGVLAGVQDSIDYALERLAE